ncbi:MAG: metallophosphoesterase [Oscillibacter sp.]|nr:metallophosphoesterase [Oscillibacter sp.]
MDEIHILHLSDLHMMESVRAANLKDTILQFAEEHFAKIPEKKKLLVLTGDFRNFKTDDDFHKAAEFIPQLWKKMGIRDPYKDVFMVPGNHDVDKNPKEDQGKPLTTRRQMVIKALREASTAPTAPTALSQAGDAYDEYMETLLSCYRTYLDFVKGMGVYTEDECNHRLPVKVHVRTWRNQLHLLHLNTTLVADGTEKTNQMADVLSAISSKDQLLEGRLPCIALGHNHIRDMNTRQWSEGLVGAFSRGNIRAYLCGDRHESNNSYDDFRMTLGGNQDLPIICAPRGSSDDHDKDSQFGLILHTWNPNKSNMSDAKWALYLWRPGLTHDFDQIGKEHPYYETSSGTEPRKLGKPQKPVVETLRQQAERWGLDDAAEFLDAETVIDQGEKCRELDTSAFYRVNDSYGVMLRVLAAGKAIPRDKDVTNITELLEHSPVLIAGNGGMGKTTLMLMTAIHWAQSGGVAVWLKLSQMEQKMDSGKARNFMETLSQWVESGQRVLLCLDSPAWGRDALQTLREAWLHQPLWAGHKTTKGGYVQLLMAERSARLRTLTREGCLVNWFDGANIVELRRSGDTRVSFRLNNYQTAVITENEYFRKRLLLNTTASYVANGVLSRQKGEILTNKVDEVLEQYNRPHVSLVELIYRALLPELRYMAKSGSIILDWEEWGRVLREYHSISADDFALYGGIAAFSLFGCPLPISLFCRQFGLEEWDFINLLRNWRLSRKSGSIEPVIYTDSDGTLEPKHDVIAELFFLFRKDEDEFYDESSIDFSISRYLDIMSETEIERLFHNMVNRENMRQLKQRDIGRINYRAYMERVYKRMQQDPNFNLSKPGRIDLCLGLLWSNGGDRITRWDEDIHNMLKDTAPDADSSKSTAILYTEWGKWLSNNDREYEAEDKFRKELNKNREDIPSRTELGKLLSRRVTDKAALLEAEHLFREILFLDEYNIHARTELGRLLVIRGNKAEAEKLFREAVAIDPQNIPPLHELGMLLEGTRRLQEAKQVYQQILRIDPKHHGASQGLKRLQDLETT